jgi:pyruvate carboxylase
MLQVFLEVKIHGVKQNITFLKTLFNKHAFVQVTK